MNQTEQDLKNIKEKLLEQIKKQYEPEKAKVFSEKIISMNNEEFVEFLKKQGIISKDGEDISNCIFCALASGRMPRTEIAENEKAIAILELNPISKGHSLIIPKEHIESEDKIPQESKNLAEKIKADLQQAFKPQRIDLIPGNIMGHQIINVLPIYSTESIEDEREKETPEGLAKIKEQILNSKPKIIEEKKETKTIEEEKPEEIKEEEKLWLPKKHMP